MHEPLTEVCLNFLAGTWFSRTGGRAHQTPALGLRQSKIQINGAKSASTHPEEAGLGSPVPRRWVDHALNQDVDGQTDEIETQAGEYYRLGS